MKHTNFDEEREKIELLEIAELKKAIELHGGTYEWNDDRKEKCPIISVNPKGYWEDTYVKVTKVFIEEELNIEGVDIYTGQNVDFDVDEINEEQIPKIIDKIPAINGVYDVTTSIKEEKEIPYRCKECGSLNIQEKAWVDSNTHEHKDSITDSNSDLWCEECCAHTDQVDETELIALINDYWWEEQAGHEKLELLIGLFSEEEDPSPEGCDQKWEELSVEQKIEIWNKYKED